MVGEGILTLAIFITYGVNDSFLNVFLLELEHVENSGNLLL